MTKRKAPKPAEIDELTLPHNLEAERSVLGAVLLHNEAYLEAAKHLRPDDFFRDAHRRIFASMGRLLEQPGGAVDLITIKDDLGKRGDLDVVGGPAYIAALVDGMPRSTNITHYAAIVRDRSLLRALIATGNHLVTCAYVGEEAGVDLLHQADRAIVDLQHGAANGRMRSTASSNAELREALEYRHAHKGELTGVETGFASINELTSGWQAGDMIVIASRPSIGKTALVMNCAVAAARTGKRVAVFSLEMRRQQLEFRLLASMSGVPLSVLLGGWVEREDQWAALSQAIIDLNQLSINIDDAASRTVQDIRAECRRLRADGGLDLVIVDYIQLMHGTVDRRGATRNEEIADISRKLKILADELTTPVIVLSQLNRAGEARSDPRPKLSDLRESGALEQDADLVCFLHRRHHRESGTTNFIVEKQRNGPTGTLNLTITRETTRFTDGGLDEIPTLEERQAEDKDAKVRAIIRRRAGGR